MMCWLANKMGVAWLRSKAAVRSVLMKWPKSALSKSAEWTVAGCKPGGVEAGVGESDLLAAWGRQ